jgi:hypothetical protein
VFLSNGLGYGTGTIQGDKRGVRYRAGKLANVGDGGSLPEDAARWRSQSEQRVRNRAVPPDQMPGAVNVKAEPKSVGPPGPMQLTT